MSANQPLITLKNISKNYASEAGIVRSLRDVSLSIEAAERVAVVGESGCGKSTLARVLCGLEPVNRGSIAKTQLITPMVFQDSSSSMNPRRKVSEILIEPVLIAQNRWRARTKDQSLALKIAELIHLNPEHLSKVPHQLSGGQRQRVNLGRAMAPILFNPDLAAHTLLVLDEPTSALDVSVQAQILNLINELQSQLGFGLILITHDLGVARFVTDRILVMYMGEIIEAGPTAEILTSPKHPYTQALIKAEPTNQTGPPQSLNIGEPLSPYENIVGCAFASRCPSVFARCRAENPSETLMGARVARCHLLASSVEVTTL